MQRFSGLNQPLKRYLTLLLYGIALGLALVLAVTAIVVRWKDAPVTPLVTLAAQAVTDAPTQVASGGHILGKPTEIPQVPPTPNEVTPSTLGVTSSDLHGKQVTVWHPWTGEAGAVLNNMLEEYSRTNQWGIKVNITAFEGFGRLDEAVETAIVSGTLPDVLIDYGYQAQHWDENGTLIDLETYVEDPLWGYTSGEQADFLPAFWAEDLVGGAGAGQTKRLGVPFYRSAYALFYNRSWAKELGFTSPPDTPEAFRSQVCAASNAADAQAGSNIPGRGGWLVTSQPGEAAGWIYAYGGSITNPAAPGYKLDTPETRQALAYIKDLLDKGCAWSDTSADARSEFANRGALLVVGSLFDIPTQQQAFNQAGNNDEWSVIPFPSRKQPVVDTYGPSIMITQSTPARQLASWLVLKWLVYPHNQIEWVKTLGVYPTRQSSAAYLAENSGTDQLWNQALSLLPVARSEPSLASWSAVRWSLADAMNELTGPKFTADQLPALLEKLDSAASEIFSQVH